MKDRIWSYIVEKLQVFFLRFMCSFTRASLLNLVELLKAVKLRLGFFFPIEKLSFRCDAIK